MNRRPTIIIAAVLAAVLLSLQFLSPIFTGDANLTLPERIRHAFVDLFGGGEDEEEEEEEEELPEFIELEQQPENGVELPMQTMDKGDEVELPSGGIAPLPESGEENELPMDVFH